MSPPPDLSGASDQEVVALARLGHEEGYRELMRRYGPAVFNRIVELVRDPDLAEDLTQETFIKAFKALGSHHPDRKLSAWIRSIAFNTTMDYFRRRRLHTLPLVNTPQTTPPSGKVQAPAAPVPGRAESREAKLRAHTLALEQAIQRLPGVQRRCIRLRFYEKKSNNEVAQILRLPVGTVKTHVHRGLDELQRMLDAIDPMSSSWLFDSLSDPFYSPA